MSIVTSSAGAKMVSGDTIHTDFRSVLEKDAKDAEATTTLRIVQFNIERGYKLKQIILLLQKYKPDIICLQVDYFRKQVFFYLKEIDINNKRTGNKDIGRDIAKALGMNYLFVCEFEERESPRRTPHLQGGGYHGNAILTFARFLI